MKSKANCMNYQDEFHFGDLIFEGIEFIDIYNTSNLEPLGYSMFTSRFVFSNVIFY